MKYLYKVTRTATSTPYDNGEPMFNNYKLAKKCLILFKKTINMHEFFITKLAKLTHEDIMNGLCDKYSRPERMK